MKKIWIIGAGYMALSYSPVLKDLGIIPIIIGRGKKNAITFSEATGLSVEEGGLIRFLDTKPEIPDFCIITVGADQLYDVTKQIIEYGIKNILVEKPGALRLNEFNDLDLLSQSSKANVYIAYNRRFYGSVLAAKDIILNDGELTSFNFEFTEWIDKLIELNKSTIILSHWFLINSSHIIDLAFHLGGEPEQITSFTSGENEIPWHSRSSRFSGAGITKTNALFSYTANWNAPGRWGVELMTKNKRLILSPLEKLQVINRNSVNRIEIAFDEELDLKYKPGLYRQTVSFLGNKNGLMTLSEQKNRIPVYMKILGN